MERPAGFTSKLRQIKSLFAFARGLSLSFVICRRSRRLRQRGGPLAKAVR